MAVELRGVGGTVAEVATNSKALLVEPRPLEYGDGSYGISLSSTTMAAGLAANAEVFQFRWIHATNVCLVQSVRLWAGGIVAFAAGFCRFELVVARTWTAAGTGGAVATLTTNNGKLRTSMSSTQLGEARCSTTAILGLGTKTLDAQGIGMVGGSTGVTAGTPLIAPVAELLATMSGHIDNPLTLVQNEGFVIRATVPATGTWTFGVTTRWTERTTF